MICNRSVCVIDDDMVHLESMSFMLRRMGFRRVLKFTDPDEAWDCIQAERPGLIVSDWDMGPMTGIELLERVRACAQVANTPFILVTGNQSEDYWKRSIEAGASEFLFKPLSLEGFAGAVECALVAGMRARRAAV